MMKEVQEGVGGGNHHHHHHHHNHASSNAMTVYEQIARFRRTCSEGRKRMSGANGYAILGGAGAVTFLGCLEGALYIKPTDVATNHSHGILKRTTTTKIITKTTTTTTTTPFLTWYQKVLFVGRYSIAQIIPSVIHATQPSTLIAQVLGLPVDKFYATPCQASPQRHLMLNRIKAIRGTLASTVILAQVLATMETIATVRKDYVDRIRNGREPPLADPSRQHGGSSSSGVIIRLAGEESFMSNLTMVREGRRHFFPIFENAQHPDVKSMVNDHAGALPKMTQVSETPIARVPVYWRVRDGAYSHKASWRGMVIPQNWLFTLPSCQVSDSSNSSSSNVDKKQQQQQPERKLLILEADATPGSNTAMSLKKIDVNLFNLDLYEISQGFTQLQGLVRDQGEATTTTTSTTTSIEKKDRNNNKLTKIRTTSCTSSFETMRILLVDPEAVYTSGGGRVQMARERAEELGLADVIVDARHPLVYSIIHFLENAEHRFAEEQQHRNNNGKGKKKRNSNNSRKNTMLTFPRSIIWKRPVVLETPRQDWFLSIKEELADHGYEVIDQADALDRFGTLDGIPFLVYERTTADTMNTVKQYVAIGRTSPQQICALCPRPWTLEAIIDTRVEGVTYISSSDIHDRLMRWVRREALKGRKALSIQQDLDTNLHNILHEVMTDKMYERRQ